MIYSDKNNLYMWNNSGSPFSNYFVYVDKMVWVSIFFILKVKWDRRSNNRIFDKLNEIDKYANILLLF